jgi:hypothetical protein
MVLASRSADLLQRPGGPRAHSTKCAGGAGPVQRTQGGRRPALRGVNRPPPRARAAGSKWGTGAGVPVWWRRACGGKARQAEARAGASNRVHCPARRAGAGDSQAGAPRGFLGGSALASLSSSGAVGPGGGGRRAAAPAPRAAAGRAAVWRQTDGWVYKASSNSQSRRCPSPENCPRKAGRACGARARAARGRAEGAGRAPRAPRVVRAAGHAGGRYRHRSGNASCAAARAAPLDGGRAAWGVQVPGHGPRATRARRPPPLGRGGGASTVDAHTHTQVRSRDEGRGAPAPAGARPPARRPPRGAAAAAAAAVKRERGPPRPWRRARRPAAAWGASPRRSGTPGRGS